MFSLFAQNSSEDNKSTTNHETVTSNLQRFLPGCRPIMETIEVHSKSFVVKWIQVPDNATIIFQVKPIKRSINLSIYKSDEHQLNTPYQLSIGNESNANFSTSLHRKRSNSTLSLSLDERLKKSNLSKVKSFDQLNGNELFKSELKFEKGGIFAFIFDNTFSKSYSKKVLFNKFFVTEHHTNNEQFQNPSLPSAHQQNHLNRSTSSLNLSNPVHPQNGQFLQGYLLKKKRKKLQGFTKRFFILNFRYNTLSYYLNENSLKTRGEMQINISTISAFKDENTIVIDSGMEIWILKTQTPQDWDNWINALDFIKLNGQQLNESTPTSTADSPQIQPTTAEISFDYDKELTEVYQRIFDLNKKLDHKENIVIVQNELAQLSLKVKSLITTPIDLDVKSLEGSIFSQDYFDAQEVQLDNHVMLMTGISGQRRISTISVDELSDDDTELMLRQENIQEEGDEDLYPLNQVQVVQRRNNVKSSTTQPQSLFSFLRKNVGKDLSTISMPVTSNEPLTILQKISEAFEHAHLLNEAALETNIDIKVIKIATFAIANLSSLRCKERNLRKPFNPILGETFEYVSKELNLRLIGEKVNHKPQIFAFHVDNDQWELTLTLNPDQKFWGKSIELINKGLVHLYLKTTGERFQWSQASTLLKNIITGDKYSEPVNSLIVTSSIGLKTIVAFKKPTGGNLFSGPSRSEELSITVQNDKGTKSEYFADGKWTEAVYLKNNSGLKEKIWTASRLLPDEAQKWGFTEFASNLNEITEIERDWIPYTDSRYRPDVRNYENGNVAEAEKLKLEIEQRQRDERKRIADLSQVFKPNFFKKISDVEYEFIKTPGVNYWDRRKNRNWNGINELW